MISVTVSETGIQEGLRIREIKQQLGIVEKRVADALADLYTETGIEPHHVRISLNGVPGSALNDSYKISVGVSVEHRMRGTG